MSSNPFDQFDATAGSGGNPFDTFDDSQKNKGKGVLGHARDLGLSLAKGVVAVPEAAVGLADIATGGQAGKVLANEDGAIGFRPKQAKEFLSDLHTDQYKEQQRQFANADGILDKTVTAVKNPSLIANAVVESLPLMGAGGAAGRGAMAVAPRIGELGAAAAGEGIVGAGSSAEQIRQETKDGLMTPEQSALAAGVGAATAGFGVLGGKAAQKMGIGDIDTMAVQGKKALAQPVDAAAANKGITRQVIEGAISEGLLEELPQSVSETLMQNIALDKPWNDGLDESIVMGTLSGMAMGGGAAGVHGVASSRHAVQAPATEQAPATDEGLSLAPIDQAAQQATANDIEAFPGGTLAVQRAFDARDKKSRPPLSILPLAPTDGVDFVPSGIAPVKPSEAMSLDPNAGMLSTAAATAVDGGAHAVAQAREQAQLALEEARKGGKAVMETKPVATDLSSRSFEELSAQFRIAQNKEIRTAIATELQRRRAEQKATQGASNGPAADVLPGVATSNRPGNIDAPAGVDAVLGRASEPAPSAAVSEPAAAGQTGTDGLAAGPGQTAELKLLADLEQPGSTRQAQFDARRLNAQATLDDLRAKTHVDKQDQQDALEQVKQELDSAAHEAATSPQNDLPEPTQAQKEAGNYKKGHTRLHGLDIAIENPAGSIRSGVDRDGKAWENQLQHHYGYIKHTEGADGDHVDTFIGPKADSQNVFVVDQIDPTTGKFDEHKVMLGFDSLPQARMAYQANYAKGWKGGKTITKTSIDEFKAWLATGDTKAPFSGKRAAEHGKTVSLTEPSGTAPQSEPQNIPKNIQASENQDTAKDDSNVPTADPPAKNAPAVSNDATTVSADEHVAANGGKDAAEGPEVGNADVTPAQDAGTKRTRGVLAKLAERKGEAAQDPSTAKKKPTEKQKQAAAVEAMRKMLGAEVGDTITMTFKGSFGYLTSGKPMVIESINSDKSIYFRDPVNGSGTFESLSSMQAAARNAFVKLTWTVEPKAEPKPAPTESAPAPAAKPQSTPQNIPENIPASDDSAKAQSAATAKISDFGQKIGGARKDVWTSFKDELNAIGDDDIANQPLSKVWPAPDYQAMIDAGADPWIVGFARATRDEVPAKPRTSYKVRNWVEKVRILREMTTNLLDGTWSKETARRELAMAGAASRGMADIAGRIELYTLVGHRQSLSGVRLSSGEYMMYKGIEYKPPKVMWTVTKDSSATAFSNWPRELAIGNTRQEALDNFKAKYDAIDINPVPSKEVTFDIYTKREDKTVWVGKKVGRNPLLLSGPFKTVKDAREYKDNNQAELVAKLEKSKEIPRERRDTNEPRIGEDMRNGQDVTPEMFGDAFGFRGVEFGNWVEQGRRQKDLNDAYDALMDMAAVLGIQPKAISLNGELGLAFGARGSGGVNPASAHYEPGKVVINLTKRQGAGSLGHEWWHALDNYFSRMRAKGGDFMTTALDVSLAARGADFVANTAVRREMIAAFGEVVKAIRQTSLKARSSKLDAKRSKEYWTTGEEMAARAFESYLISKLQDQNASNDYLANIVAPETWKAAEALGFELDDSFPYPTAGEMPLIRAGFDHFFQTIQTRETDQGIALYDRGGMFSIGMPVKEVQEEVSRIAASWKNAPKINVVESVYDLPFQAPRDIRGVYAKGQVWIVAENNNSALDVQSVLFHEVRAHAGLRGLFGSRLYHELRAIAMKNADIRNLATTWRAKNGDLLTQYKEKYGEQRGREIWQMTSIEEALADVAGEGKTITGFQRFMNALQKALRAIGFDALANWLENRTDAEVMALLAKARRYIEEGEQAAVLAGQAAPAYARGEPQRPSVDTDDRLVNIFTEIAKQDDAFRLPGSNATSLETVIADMMPGATVDDTGNILDFLNDEDRQSWPVDRSWAIRPGKNADEVAYVYRNNKAKEVWLDISNWKEGKQGYAVYQVVATWAHNNGYTFIGDPAGLSDKALYRRTEQMISSALRHGTTKHLAPHARQLEATETRAGQEVRPLRWIDGDDANNLREMLVSSYTNIKQIFPEIDDVTFNFSTGQFERAPVRASGGALLADEPAGREQADASGVEQGSDRGAAKRAATGADEGSRRLARVDAVPFTDADFRSLAESVRGAYDVLFPSSRGAYTPPIGVSDLKRAVITASVLRGESSEAGRVLLDHASERLLQRVKSSQLNQVLYSRGPIHDGAREYARQAVDTLNANFSAPGRLSWWHKTVGTMYNLAERSPYFKPVFDAAQGFIDDVSHYANDAADLAPRLLPKLENWRDIMKSPISATDNKAIARPIFEGTLSWSRGLDGKPVQTLKLEEEATGLDAKEKADRLLAADKLTHGMHKAWLGMPEEQYEKLIDSRYESQMLQPGIVWTDAELKSMFNLNEEQIGLYREFREATDRSLDTMARADMLRYGGDDVKDLRSAVMAAADAQEASILLRDRLVELSQTMPDREEQLTALAHGIIDRADRLSDLQGKGYAPLSRFGRYTVDVVADGERQYFGLFETAREANQMAERMRKEFGKDAVSQGTMSNEAFKLFAGITPESLELFGNMLGLDSTGDGARDQAFQEYLRLTKANRSAMKRLIHRQGIAGFSEDAGRVLASFIYSNARQTAAGLNMGDLGEAVNAIPKEQGELKDAAVRLSEYIKNPQEEAQAIRGLLFAQYLGGSIASAFVNMTQPAAVSFPWLSQYGGARKAAAALGRAAKELAKRGHQYEPDLAKALKHAEEDGTVSPQEVHQLMAQARGSGSLRSGDGTKFGEARARAQNSLSRLSLAWGKVFGAAEQVNRRLTFIAAYRMAKEQGIANPATFARRAVTETQFVYSKASKMQWGRGAVGGTLMTFKTYSIAYLELLHRMYTQGGPEGKKAALLAMGVLMLMGGAGGVPFAEDVEDAADGLAQLLGYNISTKKARQEFLENLFGREIANFIDKGVTGLPGAPLDVSGRLGMGNLIPGTGLFQEKSSHTRDVLEVVGPMGDFAQRIVTGGRKILGGDIGAGLLEVAPTAVRNAAKGADMAATGMYRDAKGYKVLDTTTLEAALKAIGFQPQSVATVQEANALNQQAKNFYSLKAQEIRARWAQGIFEKDPTKVQAARDEITAWNAKNPNQPMMIRIPDVMKRVREMAKSKDQRIADAAPKAMRAQLRDEIARNREN
jgi:hypothetical protein